MTIISREGAKCAKKDVEAIGGGIFQYKTSIKDTQAVSFTVMSNPLVIPVRLESGKRIRPK